MFQGVRGDRPVLVVILLAVLACSLLLAWPAVAFAVGTINGTVADEAGGPIPDAEVTVFTVDAFDGYSTTEVATTITAADGSFIVDVPAGSYIIGARKAPTYPEFQYFLPRRGGNAMNAMTTVANTGLIPVADGAAVENIDIRMQPSLLVEGRVVASLDSSPLGRIVVSSLIFEAAEGWHVIEETMTRPDGTYRLQTPSDVALAIPGVTAKIAFSDPAGIYARSVYDGQVDFDAGLDFALTAGSVSSGVDATLTVGGAISGTLRDARNGAPLPLVSVEVFRLVPLAGVYEPMNLGRLPVLSAVDGTYRWGGLPPGTYKVKFAGEPVQWGPEFYGGIHVTDGNIVPASAQSVVVPAGEEVTGVDGELDLFDGAAPLTTSNIDSSWRAPGFVVSLNATDPAYPGTGVTSGVARTEYRIGSGPLLTGVSFSVNETQTVAVKFRSVDVYGNVETTKTATLKIDSTPPVTVDDAVSSYLDSATVTLSASDGQSGVSATHYRLDGGSTKSGTSVKVFGAGTHTVEYRSTDAVGNTEPWRSATFEIVRSPVEWEQLAGADRSAMSIAVSKRLYGPDGAPQAVVVANGSAAADALAGASLAGAVDAPLLLVNTAKPGPVVQEIQRLKSLGATRLFVLGGGSSVSATLEDSLSAPFAGQAVRLGGSDRFAVSRAVALRTVQELKSHDGFDGTVFVVGGTAQFDALAASPTSVARGWPILLAHPASDGKMTSAMRSTITAIGADRAIVVGGQASVSQPLYSDLSSRLQGAVNRVGGSDRYAVAVAMSSWSVANAGMKWDGLGVSNGTVFADGISGSVLLGERGSVLLLTAPSSVPGATRTALDANRAQIFGVTFLGGSSSMPTWVRAAVLGRL